MPPYLHLSVDDAFGCLRDVFTGVHATPFTQPTFAYLRDLHERYGLRFSLYCFAEEEAVGGWRLADADGRFAEEFGANAAWLRFGFHALNAATRYSAGATTAAAAREHYGEVVEAVARFAGEGAIDRAPRLHYYTGGLDAVRAMAAGPYGLRGLLTADDDRQEVYHLDDAARLAVRARGAGRDPLTGLFLFSTDMRLERLEQATGALLALAEARATAATVGPGGLAPGVRAFTHEQYLDDGAVRRRLEDLARDWAAAGWPCAFPLDDPPTGALPT